jgi:hypothetical protein
MILDKDELPSFPPAGELNPRAALPAIFQANRR